LKKEQKDSRNLKELVALVVWEISKISIYAA